MTVGVLPHEITGSTEFVGVIGDPVRHSMSPRLHNRAYVELGLDIRYGAFRVPVGGVFDALRGARALGFRGLSITTPHKADAAHFADQRSEDVSLLGVANTIVYLAGVAVAENTDGGGLLDDLLQNCSFSPRGQSCVILGAGAAAKALVLALAREQPKEIIVVNRTRSRAEETAALAPDLARVGEIGEIGGAPLVINATSLGLVGAAGEPHDGGASLGAHLQSGQLAIDLSYRPARSPFLEVANSQGATIRNGLGMLVHQAAGQVRLFSGQDAPVEAMWEEVRELSTS